MTWLNNDGLFVKFGKEEGALARGGENAGRQDVHELEFLIDYRDALSATAAILGRATWLLPVGTEGVVVPKGARIEALETVVVTPFQSSGTIGTSTLVIGTKKISDYSTELDHDGLTTTSFVGSAFDAAGERVYIVPGVTGAGDDYGVTMTESGIICVANSQHGSHPFTAGKLRCRLFYTLPVVTSAP